MSSSSLILSSEASLFWGESFQRKTSSHHLIPRLISNFQALRLQGTKHDEGHGRRWLRSNPALGNRDTWYFSFCILFFFDISSDTIAENKESTQQKSRFFPYLFRALPFTYFLFKKRFHIFNSCYTQSLRWIIWVYSDYLTFFISFGRQSESLEKIGQLDLWGWIWVFTFRPAQLAELSRSPEWYLSFSDQKSFTSSLKSSNLIVFRWVLSSSWSFLAGSAASSGGNLYL